MDKKPAIPAHDTRPEFEYVYHWHRIIPAMASLAIGVGAVLWFWPSATTPQAQRQTAAALTAPPSQPAPLTARSVVVDLPLPLGKREQSGAVDSTLNKPAPEEVEAQAPKIAEAAPVAVPSNANALKAINDAPAPSAGIKVGQVKVVNKSVKKAALNQILDQEPLEIPKGTISLSKKKAVKVVFSADVAAANEQINYLWYLNGKLQAKVATRSSPDARTLASKYISYDAPGQWQVQMTDVDGRVLAETAFAAKRN